MHNFTGSTRRPRNVNLSGKRATPSSPFGTAKSGLSASLIHVREERAAREEERKRLGAATTIQRTWRGRQTAELQRHEWRKLWTHNYTASVRGWGEFWHLLSLFLGIVDLGRRRPRKTAVQLKDRERLDQTIMLASGAIKEPNFPDVQRDERLRFLLGHFGGVLVQAIKQGLITNPASMQRSLELLPRLAKRIPKIANEDYYEALSNLTVAGYTPAGPVVEAVLEPLQDTTVSGDAAYRALGSNYLTTPDLYLRLGSAAMGKLRKGVDLGRLSRSEATSLCSSLETEGKLWLLAYVIHFGWSSTYGLGNEAVDLTSDGLAAALSAGEEYVSFLSQLLAGSALEIGQRINVNDHPMGDGDSDHEDNSKATSTKKQPLPEFVKLQIASLVKQSSVNLLLSKTKSTTADIKVLAGFALTLLVVFPSMKDEVRLWLCLAKTEDGVPAVRYVWDAVKACGVFSLIKRDTSNAILSLKYEAPTIPEVQTKEEELNLVFLFLEMYGFLLSVTYDNEFFSGGKGRQLPLDEVKDLTVFLKNIGFAMYWWSGEIMGDDPSKDTSGEVWFKQSSGNGRGWEVKQFRDAVTNVMRAIYARDSRRHFLPKDHWLMTDRLNMEGLIAAAVQEEENREKQMENDSDPEEEDDSRLHVDHEALAAADPMTRRYLRVERIQRIQRRKQKMNYLAAIAPRLEILQNLPFFIPFSTRVQIFRHFVNNDQKKRRKTGPWAFDGGMLEDREMSKHHATIRRGNEFDDAYEQYWTLGEGLKEPIQITFIDKFGAEEAGIDGGGVTKEFLTGVIGEAFAPDPDDDDDDYNDKALIDFSKTKNLFRANAEHLLYPNPTSIDNLWHRMALSGISHAEGEKHICDLFQRYEFAGRILGKCLYEGILVDVAFAPFFLLKWSQPHSASAVGINDLRDLDADFYRHLMALKDFDGDVESVFGLDFTITTGIAPGKTVTRPLKPHGGTTPVTNQNRLEYIHLVSRYRLSTEPQRQTAAFLRGLTTLVQPSWLRMFNQSELQTLVGGDTGSPIDVEDLRRNTEYGGTYVIGDDGQEHESVKLFWQVMHEFDNEQRGKVLKFVTSVSRAPLLGFGVLKPRFSIRDGGSDQQRLCSASTCVNLLKMPMYRDKKLLRAKLLYSVTSNAGFDLS